MNQESEQESRTPSLLGVFGSVLASMFGVQSSRKRHEDFSHGKPFQYIIVGLVMTVVFILTVWGVVSIVMRLSGL
ncbi:MAG: DUF2970 domain-containing protein [Gammaproteobacteria bacterium]|nr:DUF2970 domain-containing protein [Gammaproteobacteria bacterium]